MNRASTHYLRAFALIFGLVVLVLCAFALPAGLRSPHAGAYKPLLLGMYLPAIPFYIGVYQAFKLLGLIDRQKAFSEAGVRTLSIIKVCGLTISGLYAISLPFAFLLADRDDAPGVLLLALILTLAPLAVGVIAGVLQSLLQHAIDIKSEHDLTV